MIILKNENLTEENGVSKKIMHYYHKLCNKGKDGVKFQLLYHIEQNVKSKIDIILYLENYLKIALAIPIFIWVAAKILKMRLY